MVVRAYFTVLDERMGELMDRAANLEHAPRNAVMTPGEVAKSKKLYYILMMLVERSIEAKHAFAKRLC